MNEPRGNRPAAERMTGGDAIVRSLIAYGVDTVFGLPGIQLDNTFDALYRHSDRIRLMHTRHEQGCAYMALGYAQASGRVGTFIVVPGPGVLNTTAALSTAAGSNAPVLCLTGQIPSYQIGLGLGMAHEIRDQLASLRGVVKWAGRADAPAEAPYRLREAFQQMLGARHQPVSFEMAPDVMGSSAPVRLLPAERWEEDPEPDPEGIAAAAALIRDARRPAIFVGSGVFGAEAEQRALAEAMGAPGVMSRTGRGALSDRHDLALGLLGGQYLWEEIDLAIVVGTRFMTPALSWGREDAVKVIRIDVDPVQIDKPRRPEVAIHSGAARGLAALADALERAGGATAWPTATIADARRTVASRLAEIEPQAALAGVVRDELPDDGIVVVDVTQLSSWVQFGMPVYEPRTLITAGYQGTLGYALPTALGAKVAMPGRKVVTIIGDGGFMFNVQELSTAVAHGLEVVVIVVNDGHFGNVKRFQKLNYGARHIAVELANPDFVRLAESFGMWARRAEGAAELRSALREAFAVRGPTLIEVPVGELPNIWSLVKRPPSAGVRR